MDHNPHLALNDRCSYCGSISPLKAIELLKTPGTDFSGADWKYGWPHKFKLNDSKFYNSHPSSTNRSRARRVFTTLSSRFWHPVHKRWGRRPVAFSCR